VLNKQNTVGAGLQVQQSDPTEEASQLLEFFFNQPGSAYGTNWYTDAPFAPKNTGRLDGQGLETIQFDIINAFTPDPLYAMDDINIELTTPTVIIDLELETGVEDLELGSGVEDLI
jgi:hypothetical protein